MALTALVMALPIPASAACVVCSCTVDGTPIAFGTYDPMSASPSDSDGSVLLTCGGLVGGEVSYSVALGKGLGSSVFSPRKMLSGIQQLHYDLYTSSAYLSVWGDGTAGSQSVSGTITISLLSGTTRELVVSGRIPGSQTTAQAGVYSDTWLITVTYN